MPTGQVIANNVLNKLGILELGGTPSASDSVAILTEMNAMWNAWGIDEGLIYSIQAIRQPLVANIGVYTIGLASSSLAPQPNFKFARPSRIYRASITSASANAIGTNVLYSGGTGYAVNDTGVVLGSNGTQATYTVNTVSAGVVATYTLSGSGTGYTPQLGALTATGGAQPGSGTGFRITISTVSAGGTNRNPLKIIEAAEYYDHNDLSASGASPDELYPDYNVNQDGFATLYLFPVPTVLSAQEIELETGVTFSDWTLTGTYLIPQGYQDLIENAVAWRMISYFGGIVAPQVMQTIAEIGQKAELRIRTMNASNRKMPFDAMILPGQVQAPQPAQKV